MEIIENAANSPRNLTTEKKIPSKGCAKYRALTRHAFNHTFSILITILMR